MTKRKLILSRETLRTLSTATTAPWTTIDKSVQVTCPLCAGAR